MISKSEYSIFVGIKGLLKSGKVPRVLESESKEEEGFVLASSLLSPLGLYDKGFQRGESIEFNRRIATGICSCRQPIQTVSNCKA